MRHTAKIDPWNGQNDATIIDSQIPQYATGKGVDLIVCDEDMWFGHVEFMNPSGITDIKQSDNATAASTAAPDLTMLELMFWRTVLLLHLQLEYVNC